MKLYLSLSTQIVIAIFLGLGLGIFLGKDAEALAPIGNAFVMLLQMPVLIFMFCSIIVGIGRLSFNEAKLIFAYSMVFLAFSFVITNISVFILPFGFPSIKVASKFASLNVHNPLKISLLDSLIPKNPFEAFAQGSVPAIVVFGIFFAIALVRIKKRGPLLLNITIIKDTVSLIALWITKLSPIGVFALTASISGSLQVARLEELKYYYYAFIFAAIFVSLLLIPLLVSIFIPLSYKQIIGPLKPALLLAFATGSALVSLPIVMDIIKARLKEQGFLENRFTAWVDTLLPLTYNFPISGKLINLLFIYFVGWQYNTEIEGPAMVELSSLGFFSLFASAPRAIGLLLHNLSLPADAIDLFIPNMVLTSRFEAMARIASLAALCFFTVSSVEKRLTFKLKTCAIAIFTIILGFSLWFLLMATIAKPIINENQPYLRLAIEQKAPFSIVKENLAKRDSPVLKSIKREKTLRVGFNDQIVPFSYRNYQHELVGFDIAMAHRLAIDLEAELIFVPFSDTTLIPMLKNGNIDIAMSALNVSKQRIEEITFTNPYLEAKHVFVVKDEDKDEFINLHEIINKTELKIAVLKSSSVLSGAIHHFANDRLVLLNSADDFLHMHENVRLFYWSKPEAQTWTLINPFFSVIEVEGLLEKEAYAYAIKSGEEDFLSYLNNWLDLEQSQGSFREAYNKWVIGK